MTPTIGQIVHYKLSENDVLLIGSQDRLGNHVAAGQVYPAVVVRVFDGGVGANLAALITEQAFDDLDAPVERVTGANAPMPYARNLERLKTPTKEKIVDALRRVCYANGGRS